MKKIVFLTTQDARYGFNLAGVQQAITDSEGAAATLAEVLEDENTGLVAIDERLVSQIGEESLHDIDKHWPGIIIVLPAPEEFEAEEDYANRLISRAVGYQIRLSA